MFPILTSQEFKKLLMEGFNNIGYILKLYDLDHRFSWNPNMMERI
jgi:hypothetical protein